ncbi:leukocyte elastase inhibitor-like [Hyposmocoma kahamanoa]|uniref:leukocyte elastase inhibitor-like n=1 Tax=Hyposmocoma kahamanoa TaxID=1477025 RepID=UPI000E6DA35A|nr:leukocyte elastase inhibitor-like [Hyposmocoma kahamanoa]
MDSPTSNNDVTSVTAMDTNQADPSDPLVSEPSAQPRIQLSGSRQKRLQGLMRTGMSYAEALPISEKPWSDVPVSKPPLKPKAQKRERSVEASPREHVGKAPRAMAPADSRNRPTFSEMASSLRVGIRNSESMSEEQMELMELFLVHTIASADWLVGKIGNLKPWPEAPLSLIKESKLPKPTTATTYIPKKGFANQLPSTVMALILVVLSVVIPGIFSQCTVQNAKPYFRRSVYEFTTDLVQRIATETDNHFVTSALSPWTLLSAVSLGATDETLDEIIDVLRLHPHQCFNNKFFEIVKQMTATSEGTVFERSSSLFLDDRFPLNPVFKARVKRTQVCNIETLQFDNFAETANTINEFINQATHGTIDEMITPNDLEGVYLVLVDALYFKGSWMTKFSSADTETSAFYDENGNQLGDVNLMFSTQTVNMVSIRQIGATVLELPYGVDGRFSMLFILPDQHKTITSVIEKLKNISLSSIFILSKQQGPQHVMVQVPRFKISTDLNNLKELLTDMGLKTLFDNVKAKLADISDYSLYISNIFQKANIEVNEEGSEASAASAALFEGRSATVRIEQFVANKPFLFMIVDKETEIALFTGAYSKPSLY